PEPVEARGVGGVDNLGVVVGRAVGLVEERPHMVEQLPGPAPLQLIVRRLHASSVRVGDGVTSGALRPGRGGAPWTGGRRAVARLGPLPPSRRLAVILASSACTSSAPGHGASPTSRGTSRRASKASSSRATSARGTVRAAGEADEHPSPGG